MAGGAQKQLVGLACLLKQRGYDTEIITYYKGSDYESDLNNNSIPHNVITETSNVVKRFFVLLHYLKRNNTRIVISFQTRPSLLLCVIKLLRPSLRLIVSERNTSQKYGMFEKICFNAYRVSDFVVPNSFSQEAFLKQHAPFLTNKLITITNFVDTSYYVPSKVKENREYIRLLTIARITPQKNTLNYIKAIKEVYSHNILIKVDWYGYIQGDGSYYKQCEQLISELGLNDIFEFHQPINTILEEYHNTDFFCLPSIYEGTPNVILEAMSCGVPIICSDVCDNSRYVSQNGWLFNPHIVSEMSETIIKALETPRDERDRMGNASRSIATNMLSPDSFVNKYLGLINKL